MKITGKVLANLDEIVQEAERLCQHKEKPHLYVAPEVTERLMRGIQIALKKDLISPVFFGDESSINNCLQSFDFNPLMYDIRHVSSPKEAVIAAGNAASHDPKSLLLPGNYNAPPFFRYLFDNKCLFRRRGDFLSLVGVMQHPKLPKLLLISDVGLVPDPTVEQGISIINNAVLLARVLGRDVVRVGLLAYEEVATPSVPTTISESIIWKYFREENDPSTIVEGPIRLDTALRNDAIPSIRTDKIAQGSADVLIANNIHVGNTMYKALVTCCGASSALLVIGGQCPIAVPSESEPAENLLFSIAAAVVTVLAGSTN